MSFNPLTDFHYCYSGGGKLSQVMPLGKAFGQVTGIFQKHLFCSLHTFAPPPLPRAPLRVT
jgi:hypothetical protein